MEKTERLLALYQDWWQCQRCQLAKERTNVVFGFGNPDADVLIVGEAPGRQEDEVGKPFVGDAGRLLQEFLASVSSRPEVWKAYHQLDGAPKGTEIYEAAYANLYDLLADEFYISNVVACKPPDNRDPAGVEITACRPRLLEIIYTIDPMLIIAVGRIAAEALLGRKITITSSRGQLFDMTFYGKMVPYQIPVLATLHTSYLLRRTDVNQPEGNMKKTYDDFLHAMRILDEFRERHYGMDKPKRPLE